MCCLFPKLRTHTDTHTRTHTLTHPRARSHSPSHALALGTLPRRDSGSSSSLPPLPGGSALSGPALSGPAWGRWARGDRKRAEGAALPPPPDSPLLPAPPAPRPHHLPPRERDLERGSPWPAGLRSARRGAGSGGGRERAREPASPRAERRGGEGTRCRAGAGAAEAAAAAAAAAAAVAAAVAAGEGGPHGRTDARTDRAREAASETSLARRSRASGGCWALPRAAGRSAPPRPPAPGCSFLARAGRRARGPGWLRGRVC